MVSEPLVARATDKREHDVAFVELHESVVELPRVSEVGFAECETVGVGIMHESPLAVYPVRHPHCEALSTSVPFEQYFGFVAEHWL